MNIQIIKLYGLIYNLDLAYLHERFDVTTNTTVTLLYNKAMYYIIKIIQ